MVLVSVKYKGAGIGDHRSADRRETVVESRRGRRNRPEKTDVKR